MNTFGYPEMLYATFLWGIEIVLGGARTAWYIKPYKEAKPAQSSGN